MGGSSSINGQVAPRPPLSDFDAWVERGSTWAIEDVLAAFVQLEDDDMFGDDAAHGRGGPIPIARAPLDQWGDIDVALREAAMAASIPWMPDGNAPGSSGVSILAYTARNGVRFGTNEAYLEPARDDPIWSFAEVRSPTGSSSMATEPSVSALSPTVDVTPSSPIRWLSPPGRCIRQRC